MKEEEYSERTVLIMKALGGLTTVECYGLLEIVKQICARQNESANVASWNRLIKNLDGKK